MKNPPSLGLETRQPMHFQRVVVYVISETSVCLFGARRNVTNRSVLMFEMFSIAIGSEPQAWVTRLGNCALIGWGQKTLSNRHSKKERDERDKGINNIYRG